MSKIVEKGKTAVKSITESPKTVVMQLLIGGAIGVLIDLFLEFIMWHGLGDLIKKQEWMPERLEVGFPFYATHDITSIAWDDVLLLIITIGMLFFGWFRKRFWFIIGFFFGWYGSSSLGLYNALLKPIVEETKLEL